MSYLNKMYGNKAQTQSSSDKNPNRVAGGLKAQGVDHVTMVNEDGSETRVATQRYVQSLEEQIRKVRAENIALQKRINRLDQAHSDIQKALYSRGWGWMKYYINFGDDYKLSFEILDNPIAKSWTEIMQESMENNLSEQRIRRSVFPALNLPIIYFNELKYYFGVLKDEYKLDLEFDLPSKEIWEYSDVDYNFIDEKVDFIYNKVVRSNYYYNTKEKDLVVKWAEFLYHLKENKEKLLDCYYNKENNARISTKIPAKNKIRITEEMRKKFWVETESPKIVLRLDTEFDEKTLDLAAKRNCPRIVSSNGLVSMDYIASSYKICYNEKPVTPYLAARYMRLRRDTMSEFVEKNDLKIQSGDYRHYYFVNPVVAHCLNTDISVEDIHAMFTKYSNITAEFGE